MQKCVTQSSLYRNLKSVPQFCDAGVWKFFTPENFLAVTKFLFFQVEVKKNIHWLILFTDPEAAISEFCLHQATWDGVLGLCRQFYPEAVDDVERNLHVLKTRPYAQFESDSGLTFLDCKNDAAHPFHLNYERFVALPPPRSAWQTRLFLFCELRLTELYAGDGYTQSDGADGDSFGGKRYQEFICKNYELGGLVEKGLAVILPLTVTLPWHSGEMVEENCSNLRKESTPSFHNHDTHTTAFCTVYFIVEQKPTNEACSSLIKESIPLFHNHDTHAIFSLYFVFIIQNGSQRMRLLVTV